MDKWQAQEFLIATSFCFSCFKWFDSLKVMSGFGLINAFTLINFKNAFYLNKVLYYTQMDIISGP